MKTLVIHPDDRSTDFLKPIYKHIIDKTVVVSQDQIQTDINSMIDNHDRVIMLGHGSTRGLFGIGFDSDYIIDNTNVDYLLKKKDNIFIWCNADVFVTTHKLKGLYSGMFISEVGEAYAYKIQPANQDIIDSSNDRFARILGSALEHNLSTTYSHLKQEYTKVANSNIVAKYNNDRLYLMPA